MNYQDTSCQPQKLSMSFFLSGTSAIAGRLPSGNDEAFAMEDGPFTLMI